MTTKIKIGISESQKAYTAQTEVSSDELSYEEVRALALKVAEGARDDIETLNMKYKVQN
jgi:hypothetical protein